MAITTSGNISIKETAGAANSIDTVVTSVSSGSLVALSQNSIDYQGSSRATGTADTDASPYGMLEFSGYAHSSIGTWPLVGPPGPSGSEIQFWGTEDIIHPTNNVDAWCEVQLSRDDANNRIKVLVKSGTSVALATDYTGYITYTGMSSATFYVKHNYSGSITDVSNQYSGYHYPDASSSITKDTYRQMTTNLGIMQYHWIAARTTTSNFARARVVNTDVQFTVKIVSGGVDYTVSNIADSVLLTALKGQEL